MKQFFIIIGSKFNNNKIRYFAVASSLIATILVLTFTVIVPKISESIERRKQIETADKLLEEGHIEEAENKYAELCVVEVKRLDIELAKKNKAKSILTNADEAFAKDVYTVAVPLYESANKYALLTDTAKEKLEVAKYLRKRAATKTIAYSEGKAISWVETIGKENRYQWNFAGYKFIAKVVDSAQVDLYKEGEKTGFLEKTGDEEATLYLYKKHLYLRHVIRTETTVCPEGSIGYELFKSTVRDWNIIRKLEKLKESSSIESGRSLGLNFDTNTGKKLKFEPNADHSNFDLEVIATKGLNLRSGPGTGYVVIGQVVQNDELKKIGFKSGWYEVETKDGETGWVCAGTNGETWVEER